MKNKKTFNLIFIFLFVVLAIYVALMTFLFGWGFMTSFKAEDEILNGINFGYSENKMYFPKVWHFSNYADVITKIEVVIDGRYYTFMTMLKNTLLYNVGTAFVSTLVPCVVAYLVATYDKFYFSKLVYGFVILTMILPIVGAAPSTIQVLRFLHYYDSIIGMWLMNFNFLVGLHFLVFYDAFKGLSKTYKEAAEIDGASQFRIMTAVMMPLVKTIFVTVFILRFIAYWNEYQTPILYMPHKPTIAYGIFQFFFMADYDTPTKLAGAFIVAIPITVLYIISQKTIMQNVTVGGIKG